jgi:hypothetical protein
MKNTNKLGVDVDDIVKIIKASKNTCHDCQTNTCKVHKAGGAGKIGGSGKSASTQSGNKIKMNRGGRFSGRAGKPSNQSSYTNDVFRQIPETTLQADTAKLSNELVKYQLELTRKQAENNQQQQNYQLINNQQQNNQQQNRFKSNKFLNDDDEYGTPPRFSNNYLSRGMNLSMLYDQKKRIDALESGNYFGRMMGNPQFNPTESSQIEFVDNDNYDDDDDEDEMSGSNLTTPIKVDGISMIEKSTAIKKPLIIGDLMEDPFADSVSIFEKVSTGYQFDNLNSPFVGDIPFVGNSPFVGDNPMKTTVGVSVNNPKQSVAFAEEEEPEPNNLVGVSVNNNIQYKKDDEDILSEQKPENQLKTKIRAGSGRKTTHTREFMVEKINFANDTLPPGRRYTNLKSKKILEIETIYLQIFGE